jgi:hypothetical protein
MKSWVLAAGLLAAAVSPSARAADLEPPEERYGSAYDDPRYADIYRYPDRAPRYAEPRPQAERYYRWYEEEDDREPHRYAERNAPPGFQPQCLPPETIRHRLVHEGWFDLHDVELRGDVAVVHARRGSGRPFALTVDRCSGALLAARPLEPGFGPYAYGAPWRRPY